MALVRLTGLCKGFHMGSETIRALDGVSLHIERGEFCSIAGPSGCGKSTLLNILGLVDVPDRGEYYFETKAVSQLTDDDRSQHRNQNLGFVFQNFNLLPRMTALRNVEMPLIYSASYDRSFSKERMRTLAVEALRRVGLEERMHHRPNELSGGQRQRVAIARSIVNRPSLLLADEPTGNLDSKSGASILDLFDELNRQGMTIVVVTHDPEVAKGTKHQIRMRDGRVEHDART